MKKTPLWIIASLLLTSCQAASRPTFLVRWLNYDGSVLEVDEEVVDGSMPHYDGEEPVRPKDDDYSYRFVGWDQELAPVKANVDFVALFQAEPWEPTLAFSHPSGFYDEPISVSISAPQGYEVHYTLNHFEPTLDSPCYDTPILVDDASSKPNFYSVMPNISSLEVYYPENLVDKATILKAFAINPETGRTSRTYDMIYFVGLEEKGGYRDMPVISLDVDDGDLFDYERGIYVTGKIYDESPHEGYPETYPANYNEKGKQWERFARFKYFEPDHSLGLEQDIGIRIHGGWSRAFNQKSFNLYARKELDGNSVFQKAFFRDIKAHSLMLRSGGYRDTVRTKCRDSLVQSFSQNMLFDTQQSAPVAVFLNGEYWGIYNLQERYSDNYVSEHHGVNKNEVLIIRNDEIDEGKQTDFHYYEELQDFFADADCSSTLVYQQACQFIDPLEFAQYMAQNLYVGNIDWPGNNVRLWKDVSSADSKWHFMMYDTDDSMDILSHMCGPDIDPFLRRSHWKSGPLETDCLLGSMLLSLLKNEEFKSLFREQFIQTMEDTFSLSHVSAYLEAKEAMLLPNMAKHYERFVDELYGQDHFLEEMAIIRSFFSERPQYALTYLNEHIPA